MSEVSVEERKAPRYVHVEAQADHLESLARGKPVNALAELIWNALDADADRVRIAVTDGELGNPTLIEVSDNGMGITLDEAERAFGNLGGSWKRDRPITLKSNKKMHGRNGKGRFKAFALGNKVVWDTAFLDSGDTLVHYSIEGQADRLQDFEIGDHRPQVVVAVPE